MWFFEGGTLPYICFDVDWFMVSLIFVPITMIALLSSVKQKKDSCLIKYDTTVKDFKYQCIIRISDKLSQLQKIFKDKTTSELFKIYEKAGIR